MTNGALIEAHQSIVQLTYSTPRSREPSGSEGNNIDPVKGNLGPGSYTIFAAAAFLVIFGVVAGRKFIMRKKQINTDSSDSSMDDSDMEGPNINWRLP